MRTSFILGIHSCPHRRQLSCCARRDARSTFSGVSISDCSSISPSRQSSNSSCSAPVSNWGSIWLEKKDLAKHFGKKAEVQSYTVDEVALRHGAGVEKETTDPEEAYAAVRERFGLREHSPYQEGWLPG